MMIGCLARFDDLDLTYLFHIHTNHTDGSSSVRDYFEMAKSYGIKKLIFLEHIRKYPKFDVYQFVDEIRRCSELFEIEGVVGFETKILPGGQLDIRDEHISIAQFIGVAEHSFLLDEQHLVDAFREILHKYPSEWGEKTFVWVHPGLWFQRRGILGSKAYEDMLMVALQSGIMLECNVRYSLPKCLGDNWPLERVIVGLDAHSVEDLRKILDGERFKGVYEG